MNSQSDSDNPYHQHLENCEQCRRNPFNMCDEGDRTLQLAVSSGSTLESDQLLDQLRNSRGKD